MKKIFIFWVMVGSNACGNGASHLPGVSDIPSVISGEIENLGYEARKKKVREFVIANLDKLRSGNQKTIEDGMKIANVKEENKSIVLRELQNKRGPILLPSQRIAELEMEVYSKFYPWSKEEPTHNGFRSEDLFSRFNEDVRQRPNIYYEIMKTGRGAPLTSFLKEMKLTDSQQMVLIAKLHASFPELFIESIVSTFMVFSN